MIDASNQLFHILQICDSNFPSGAFSHSFGLETYIQEGIITDKNTFVFALKQFLNSQFVYTDGLACKMVYDAINNGQFDKIWKIDKELFALASAKETREGNKRIGRQLTKVINQLFDIELLNQYETMIKNKQQHGHNSIVFAILCNELNISLSTTLNVYLFATTNSLIQNGVRGIPLGQTDGQKILQELQPFFENLVDNIMNLSEEQFGAIAPGLEIAQMMHEQLTVRLFMS